MQSNDFAQKHALCEYGMSQYQIVENRDLKDIWHDQNLAAGGTILMWIASRAQYEKKALIRCCAELAQEVTPHTGASQPAAESAIRKVLDWCEGKADREQIDAMVRDCLEHAKAAGKRAGSKAERWAWSALSTLGRCVRSTSSCSGLASAVAATAEAAGESAEAAQQRLASMIRSRLPWDSVETTIRAEKTSPKPRKKSAEETAAETTRIVSEFEQLLNGLKELQTQKEAAFAAAGTTSAKIQGLLKSDRVGPRAKALMDAKLAELEAADDRPAESSKPSAAPPRRPRMVV